MHRLLAKAAAALLLLSGVGGCGYYENDRMAISPAHYEIAQGVYDRTGSLAVTREELEKLHWQKAEVNEAVYRLTKVYRLE